MQTTVAKRSKPTNGDKRSKTDAPNDLESVLRLVRALWESIDATDEDLRNDLAAKVIRELVRLDKQVRTKVNVARMIRSKSEANAAQAKLFADEQQEPPVTRFDSPEVRVFVTDLAEQSLKFLPEAAKFSDIEDYRNLLVEKLSYNSVSTRKRNAGYLINRFFPGQYLHPDLTSFCAAMGEKRLGDVAFYLTARSEKILQLIAEKVVWPALPVGHVNRTKVRDLVKDHLKADAPAKRTTIAVAQCYAKFGIADVSKTKISPSIRFSDLASFAYLLHLEFPEPGMQSFETLLNGPLHKWLLWDRQWMVEQLYLCRQAGLLTKISEIDSMRQFTTKYSLGDSVRHIVKLVEKENS